MNIFIGADHRGFGYKESLKTWLTTKGFSVTDCGAAVHNAVDDFTDFSFAVAQAVAGVTNGEDFKKDLPGAMGIVICGSGGGVTIAANKVKGIRCGQGVNIDDVVHNRKHDNINILAIGSDFITKEEAIAMVNVFLTTSFLGDERFLRRLKKIHDYEVK